MLTTPAARLLRLAYDLRASDPLAAYDLEQSVLALAGLRKAVINPGVKKFEEHVESMIGTLKSVRQDLKKALDDIETAEEFAKFFNEGALDEELKQLQKLLERGSKLPPIPKAAAVAGPLDWIKKKFKKDKRDPEPDADAGMTPSYRMDESMMDEFVEGSRDWADPGHYIEQESKENKEFFADAKELVQQLQGIKKKPDKSSVQKLMDRVDQLIRKGGNVLKGIYKHLEEPAVKPDIGEGEPKKPPSAPGKGKKVFNLEGTVDHYADMLKESSGDEKKTLSLLKELFKAVEPALGGDQAVLASRRIASVLIRTAHANPRLRPGLRPLILKAVGRT